MKRPPFKTILISALLLGSLIPTVGAVGPDDPEPIFARKFCSEQKNPANSLSYYPNGEIRADVSCAMGGGYLAAQFYNEHGKLTRVEHLAPGLPGQHDVQIYEYTADGSRPARIKIYDPNGTLLKTQEMDGHSVVSEGSDEETETTADVWDRSRASYRASRLSPEAYTAICRKNALLYQQFLTGETGPVEFDVDKACGCVAKRLVNDDPASGHGAQDPEERVNAVAMYEPQSCICPNALADSNLKKHCDQK